MTFRANEHRHAVPAPRIRVATCALLVAISLSGILLNGQSEPAKFAASPPNQEVFQSQTDLVSYCASVAGTGEHAQAIAKTCEFALTRDKTLPDVLCDRTMRRSWSEYGSSSLGIYEIGHTDVVTANVRYSKGEEQFENLRVNGKVVDPNSPEVSTTWSAGEFSSVLSSIFLPVSKAAFRFEKEATIHSQKVLVFHYQVEAANNKSYVLNVEQDSWYPAYSGRFWVAEGSLQLVGLERETPYMQKQPMHRMTTTIDYADLLLGDGTRMVLPTHSEVLICMPAPLRSMRDSCAHHSITFTDWRKFRGTAKVLPDSQN